VDIEHLKSLMTESVAGLMLTNPNTLGLFERNIEQVAQIVHDKGGLLYGDGANANAFLGKARPGDLGFDVIQLNLHKTFSTPHGGGGPGSGPVGVSTKLVDYLPVPRIVKSGKGYNWSDKFPNTIGRVRAFYGNFNVVVKAYTYIRSIGTEGLTHATEMAVLNANYILASLKDVMTASFDGPCMHEALFDDRFLKDTGVTTLDLAKALLDEGIHPMTMYFPLVVHGAMLIEPTETESRETLDNFIQVMRKLAEQALSGNVDLFHQAPRHTPLRRLDETLAARRPVLKWTVK